VQGLRHVWFSMPQGLVHSVRAVTHGVSHLFCCSMQVFRQAGPDAACAELVKATAASMAAISILIMDAFPLDTQKRVDRSLADNAATAAQQLVRLVCKVHNHHPPKRQIANRASSLNVARSRQVAAAATPMSALGQKET
jgi:hypothetical protein